MVDDVRFDEGGPRLVRQVAADGQDVRRVVERPAFAAGGRLHHGKERGGGIALVLVVEEVADGVDEVAAWFGDSGDILEYLIGFPFGACLHDALVLHIYIRYGGAIRVVVGLAVDGGCVGTLQVGRPLIEVLPEGQQFVGIPGNGHFVALTIKQEAFRLQIFQTVTIWLPLQKILCDRLRHIECKRGSVFEGAFFLVVVVEVDVPQIECHNGLQVVTVAEGLFPDGVNAGCQHHILQVGQSVEGVFAHIQDAFLHHNVLDEFIGTIVQVFINRVVVGLPWGGIGPVPRFVRSDKVRHPPRFLALIRADGQRLGVFVERPHHLVATTAAAGARRQERCICPCRCAGQQQSHHCNAQ